MNTELTICQSCGKPVHVAPGICVLCGQSLGAIYVVKAPQSNQKPQPVLTLAYAA